MPDEALYIFSIVFTDGADSIWSAQMFESPKLGIECCLVLTFYSEWSLVVFFKSIQDGEVLNV